MPKLIDRAGEKIGRWKVIGRADPPSPDDPSIKRRKEYNPDAKKVTWWLCHCDCGTERIVAGNSLRARGSESCGCFRRQPVLEFGRAATNRILKNYTSSAKERGLIWALTFDEFQFLIRQDCHYCGYPPNQIMHGRYPQKPWWEPILYNGIDRRDNNKGYTLENCLPCCGVCNMMKRQMGYDDFLEHIEKISALREVRYAGTCNNILLKS